MDVARCSKCEPDWVRLLRVNHGLGYGWWALYI